MFRLNLKSIFAALLVKSVTSAGPSFCGSVANGGPPPMQNTYCSFSCTDAGDVINNIVFASYGTPTGNCPNYVTGSCNAGNSTSFVQNECVGKQSCIIYPNTTTFGDPCFGTAKIFEAVLTCSRTLEYKR